MYSARYFTVLSIIKPQEDRDYKKNWGQRPFSGSRKRPGTLDSNQRSKVLCFGSKDQAIKTFVIRRIKLIPPPGKTYEYRDQGFQINIIHTKVATSRDQI